MFELSPRLCMLAMRIMSDEIARVRTALKETPPLEDDGGETPNEGGPSAASLE
jgi:hypothetical protein